MTPRLYASDEIGNLPTLSAQARAVRAYFQDERQMRMVRDEIIRRLRADGVSIAETAEEVACSIATVKTASRYKDAS